MLLENENFINYEIEKNFIMSPYNKSSFYIPGKGITVDEDGNIRFYPLDDINDFVYGQDIESEFLFDAFQLTSEEKENIKQLQSVNVLLDNEELSAVYMRKENNQLFLFLTSESSPEVFYKVADTDINKVTKDKLPKIPPNKIENAELIKF